MSRTTRPKYPSDRQERIIRTQKEIIIDLFGASLPAWVASALHWVQSQRPRSKKWPMALGIRLPQDRGYRHLKDGKATNATVRQKRFGSGP